MARKEFNEDNISPKVFTNGKSLSAFSNVNAASTKYQDNTVNYLSVLSANSFTQHYTRCSRMNLDCQQGDLVLDVGCGRGVDLAEIASQVGSTGVVIGVDSSEKMIAEARSVNSTEKNISFTCANGCNLPFPKNYFSSARTIRTLQHVENPEQVVAQMHRVVRPGGRLVILEPDWGQLLIEDTAYLKEVDSTTHKVLDVARNTIQNPYIGQQLPQICIDEGLAVISVTPFIREVRSFAEASSFYSLSKCAAHLVSSGELTEERKNEWLNKCQQASDKEEFLLKLTIVMVTCSVPLLH